MAQGNNTPTHRADLAGMGILLLVALQAGASALLAALQNGAGGLTDTTLAFARLLLNAAALLVPLLFLRRSARGLGVKQKARNAAIPTCALLPLFMLATWVLNFAVGAARDAWSTPARSTAGQAAVVPNGALPLLLLFCSSCLVPAVLEELLFRGALQGLLAPYGKWPSVLAVAVLFTLMHTAGWDSATVFWLGLLLGLVRSASGSLFPCMLLHFANNLVAYISLLLQAFAPGLAWYFTAMVGGASLLGSVAAVWYLSNRKLWRLFIQKDGKPGRRGFARLSHSRLFGAALVLGLVFCVGRALL